MGTGMIPNLFSRGKSRLSVGAAALLTTGVLTGVVGAGNNLFDEGHAAAAPVTGRVFDDINNNGVMDTGEIGVPGVTVTVYDTAGGVVGTTTTLYGSPSTAAIAGTWSVSGTDNTLPYRVQFTGLQGYQPGVVGGSNGSTVQFVNGGGQANLGLFNPQAFNGSTSRLISGIQVPGDASLPGTAASALAVVAFPYSASGNTSPPSAVSTQAQVGTVFGIGVNRVTQKVYAGAYVKRHAGLGGANGDATGAIYEINPANGLVSAVYVVPNAGTIGTNVSRGLQPAINFPDPDAPALPAVGKTGLGGIEVSDDGKTLWAVNMADKSLYSTTIGGPATLTLVSPIPNPGCVGGQWRPMGLTYHLGKLYTGGVCDGSTSNLAADLKAVVLAYDPIATTWTPPLLTIPLTYNRGVSLSAFAPWADSQAVLDQALLYGRYAQPMLSDIEFLEDGSMVVAIRSRTADQLGRYNFWPDWTPEPYDVGEPAGDFLRAAPPLTAGGGVHS